MTLCLYCWRDGRLWFSDFHAHSVSSVSLAGDVRVELEINDQPSGLGWLPDGSLLVVSMVKRQLERRLAEAKQRLKSQGLAEDAIRGKEEEIRKDLQEAVEKDVRVYLTLDKIAELENIKVGEGENLGLKVLEFLLKEAAWEEAK